MNGGGAAAAVPSQTQNVYFTNCAHVLVNAIGRLLRDWSMMAPTSDGPVR